MTLTRIVLTPGEPAGIGPDLTVRLAQRALPVELVAIGGAGLLRDRAELLGLPLAIRRFDGAAPARVSAAGELCVWDKAPAAPVVPGRLDPDNAEYVLETLRCAVQACRSGSARAMVTGPVQKSVINDAGIPFTGHTEFLVAATGVDRVVMMLACEELRVALATTHIPLREVAAAIAPERLESTLRILHRELTAKFALGEPVIGVLGLNPHAGESGYMGREEIDIIVPVLEKLRLEGMNLLGPLPADTAFNPELLERCDCFLAMYHDQGLPVLKYAGFGRAVNITLGLPIPRTSVDHGTALDLAGTGRADAGSLEAALHQAAAMIPDRSR